MALDSLSAINAAFDEGRFHLQRVLKNAGTAYAGQWGDATFSSGQPGYDAHVGTPGVFVPCVAQGNDAVYFPGIGAGQERRLVNVTLRDSQSTYNGPGSTVIFDLLGYYPLLDGDSTDEQVMDNTLMLPRYATGEGVCAVMINHVSPALQAGVMTVNATDSAGTTVITTAGVPFNGINLVCSNARNTASSDVGPIAMSIGCPRGVRRINSITYTTPPSGLHAIYLIKPLMTIVHGDNLLAVEKECISHNALHCPRIHDGAWLGWFNNIGSGTARNVSWWGHFTFLWG